MRGATLAAPSRKLRQGCARLVWRRRKVRRRAAKVFERVETVDSGLAELRAKRRSLFRARSSLEIFRGKLDAVLSSGSTCLRNVATQRVSLATTRRNRTGGRRREDQRAQTQQCVETLQWWPSGKPVNPWQ